MLYTFSKAQYNDNELKAILTNIQENDIIVLWQDGVLQAIKNANLFTTHQTLVLENDLQARGLTPLVSLPVISLSELVKLTEKHSPQISF